MRIDCCVKAVLTVIAGCLIYVSLGEPPLLERAAAQAAPPASQAPVKPLPQPFDVAQAQNRPQIQTSRIISGDDIGFRIERRMGGVAVGTWMVRIGDQWVPTESMGRVVPLTH